MVPEALRGPMKALRFGTQGAVDKTAISIKDEVDAAEIAGQVFGLSPSVVRLATEGKSAIYQQGHALQERSKWLLAHHSMAVMAGDAEATAGVREDINGFNDKNPDRRILPMVTRASVVVRRERVDDAERRVPAEEPAGCV